MAKLTKKALKEWIDYLDGRGLIVTDQEMINDEVEALREDETTGNINTEIFSSLVDCANQVRMFLELHEDDEDAPAILEKAEELIEEVNNMEAWNNNAIQFPRLIAECEHEDVFTVRAFEKLMASMDLEEHELQELIKRAVGENDEMKANL